MCPAKPNIRDKSGAANRTETETERRKTRQSSSPTMSGFEMANYATALNLLHIVCDARFQAGYGWNKVSARETQYR